MFSQISWAFTVAHYAGLPCILHTNRVEGNLKTISPSPGMANKPLRATAKACQGHKPVSSLSGTSSPLVLSSKTTKLCRYSN